MQSNITEAFGAELHLAEPHFDDEATLLSARPVVPLHRLKAQARSTRLLAFGLAIVVALMVGALGATSIYKQRGQKQEPALVGAATSVSEPTSAENLTGAEAGVATFVSGEAKASAAENEADVATRKTRNADVLKKSTSMVSRNVESATTAIRPDEIPNMRDRKEGWRAERIDARLRRNARHEAGRENRRSQSPNGLLRVREIFEGPSRP